jgi:hypothetical protein
MPWVCHVRACFTHAKLLLAPPLMKFWVCPHFCLNFPDWTDFLDNSTLFRWRGTRRGFYLGGNTKRSGRRRRRRRLLYGLRGFLLNCIGWVHFEPFGIYEWTSALRPSNFSSRSLSSSPQACFQFLHDAALAGLSCLFFSNWRVCVCCMWEHQLRSLSIAVRCARLTLPGIAMSRGMVGSPVVYFAL